MFRTPAAAESLVQAIGIAFARRVTWRRFCVLMCGLIVAVGRHTVSHTLVAVGPLLQGHWSGYHRLYSHARISMWQLAAVLVRQVVALLPADWVIELVADDTVVGKAGDRVWAKGTHRDATRSSRSHDAVKFGHKWLVLCVLVQLPGWDRPWALPILCGMCLSPRVAQQINPRRPRPKTAAQLTRQLLIRLMRWLPDRRFVLTGDYQVVTHETVALAQRHAERVTVVGRLRGDANLYAPPANPRRRTRTGRLARKGRKLSAPAERVGQLKAVTQEVAWYGNSRRTVRHAGEQALWYDRHAGTVTPIRWVCVLGEPKQNLRDAFFFCSDVAADATWIIERYARRWNIEVTFEEARALLGLETTRHWCRRSVLRVTPILLGLFTAVALIWHRLPAARKRGRWTWTPCYAKHSFTFADALAAVRRELWEVALLRHRGRERCLDRLPRAARTAILRHLAAAA